MLASSGSFVSWLKAQFWKTALEFHDPVAAVAPGTWLEEAGRSP